MATRIPLPGNGAEALQKGVEQGTNIWQQLLGHGINLGKMHQQAPLMNAQTQEALANATEKMMFARLLGYEPSQGFPQIGNQFSEQTPNRSAMGQSQAIMQPGIGNPSVQMAQPRNDMHIDMPYQQPQAQEIPSKSDSRQRGITTIVDLGDPSRYAVDKIAGLHPKVPPPQTHYENGNLLTYWPSGKVTSTQIGPQPGEMERIKAVGKGQGEAYTAANEASLALGEQKHNLDRLAESLENHPNPDDVIGPMNKHLTQFFGNPEDQVLLGDIMSTSGNIVLEAAKNIKGAFTGRDQSLINGMKPTANDPYWVFLGKLKGMGELTDLAKKRAETYAELLHDSVPPHEALKIAQERTPVESITTRYGKVIEFAKQRSAIDEGKMPSFKSPEAAAEFYRSMPPDVKIKMFYKAK